MTNERGRQAICATDPADLVRAKIGLLASQLAGLCKRFERADPSPEVAAALLEALDLSIGAIDRAARQKSAAFDLAAPAH